MLIESWGAERLDDIRALLRGAATIAKKPVDFDALWQQSMTEVGAALEQVRRPDTDAGEGEVDA